MSQDSRMCQAMTDAGIDDPESYEGKQFCTKKCPYDRCIVYEHERINVSSENKKLNKEYTLKRYKEGATKDIIAIELGVTTQTVYIYIRELRKDGYLDDNM